MRLFCDVATRHKLWILAAKQYLGLKQPTEQLAPALIGHEEAENSEAEAGEAKIN